MTTFRFRQHAACAGFSLLELSVVIAIISMVAIMGLEASAAYLSSTAYKSTTDRMKTIDAALVKYRYTYGRLPCPALLPTAVTTAAYGQQDCSVAAATAGVGVANVTITAAGSGYTGSYTDVPLTITAGPGTGASATGIVDSNTGAITSISLASGGSLYSGTVTVTPQNVANGAAGADLTTSLVLSGNAIACSGGAAAPCTVPVTTQGLKYTQSYNSVSVTFTGGSATASGAASGTANVDPATGNITSITITNPGYGYQAADSVAMSLTNAKQGAGATTTVNLSAIRVGGIPVRDLNLPPSYAVDAYGSKFIYYVTDALTDTTVGPTNKFALATGVIQMRSGQLEEPCTTKCSITPGGASYAFLSVGKDRRGGYSQRGTLISNCIPMASFNSAIDAQSCIFEGSLTVPIAVTIPFGVLYNSPFNNGNQNSYYFDDLIISHTKQDL